MPTVRIDWRHNRERLVLPIVILAPLSHINPNLSIRTIGLLDTGATGTGLRKDIALELGLRAKGQRRVLTANGMINACEYLMRVGFIAGDHADPDFVPDQQQPYVMEAQVMCFELATGFAYPVLIGMDILGQCDLNITRDGRATMFLPN